MPDPRDLTTLAQLKAWLNLVSTSDDTLLQSLITAASVSIETWLGRAILPASYTETRDGTGGTVLSLANTPIVSVTSLSIDGIAIPAAPDAVTPGYLVGPTRIALVGYRFTPRPGNVLVAYSAGYAAVPPDIAQACLELCAMRYRERDRIGLAAKGLAGETTSFVIRDFPPDVLTALQQYRKVVPV